MYKIFFILRDVSDRRVFGYIYGIEEKIYKFFGIKIEKAVCIRRIDNIIIILFFF